jgi:hypothetical protein
MASHPLPTPRTWIEEWNQAEWPLTHRRERRTKYTSAKHRGQFWQIAVDPKVNGFVDIVPSLISGTPI